MIPVPGGQSLSGIVINLSSIVIAKSTIGAGASAVPIHGHQISWNSAASNVVVDGQAHPLFLPESSSSLPANNDPAATLFATTVDGHKIQATPSPSVMLIDGQSIMRGKGPILVSSTWVAMHSDGDLVIGTSTLQNFLTSLPNSAQILAAAGQATTVLSNGVVVAGSVMTTNAKAVTVAGTLSSLGTNSLVEGASMMPISTPALAASITAAGQAVTVLANGDVIISVTTLTPDDPVITIAGTPTSLGPQGLVVGASTIALSSSQPTSSIKIGGQVFPMSLATNGTVVAGTTIQAGQLSITILGTPVALKPHGLVVGTSTIPYQGTVPSPIYGIAALSSLVSTAVLHHPPKLEQQARIRRRIIALELVSAWRRSWEAKRRSRSSGVFSQQQR